MSGSFRKVLGEVCEGVSYSGGAAHFFDQHCIEAPAQPRWGMSLA